MVAHWCRNGWIQAVKWPSHSSVKNSSKLGYFFCSHSTYKQEGKALRILGRNRPYCLHLRMQETCALPGGGTNLRGPWPGVRVCRIFSHRPCTLVPPAKCLHLQDPIPAPRPERAWTREEHMWSHWFFTPHNRPVKHAGLGFSFYW